MSSEEQRPANHPFPNSYWLMPGRLACGEYPGDMDNSGEYRLENLLDAGITKFIDLTEEGETTRFGELRPYAELAHRMADERGTHATWTRCSIPDHSMPLNNAAMSRILDTIDQALANGDGVYLHCWGGIGRTGTVAGCWLKRHGMTGQEALEHLASLWQEVEKSNHRPRTPGRDSQVEFVLGWQESQ